MLDVKGIFIAASEDKGISASAINAFNPSIVLKRNVNNLKLLLLLIGTLRSFVLCPKIKLELELNPTVSCPYGVGSEPCKNVPASIAWLEILDMYIAYLDEDWVLGDLSIPEDIDNTIKNVLIIMPI